MATTPVLYSTVSEKKGVFLSGQKIVVFPDRPGKQLYLPEVNAFKTSYNGAEYKRKSMRDEKGCMLKAWHYLLKIYENSFYANIS